MIERQRETGWTEEKLVVGKLVKFNEWEGSWNMGWGRGGATCRGGVKVRNNTLPVPVSTLHLFLSC